MPPHSKRVAILAATAVAVLASGCRHRPTEKEMSAAENHFDLGVVAQEKGAIQEAMREYQKALELNEAFSEAHNATGILLHLSYRRPEEAIRHYKRALELKPDYSEVKTNLGNVYLDMGRYDDAIKLYDQALNDMLYPTPYIAHSNRGWALYKKGEVQEGVESIQMALTANPRFCLGHKNLGQIQDEQGNTELACLSFGRYRDACPDAGDAYFREGVCLAKLGQTEEARKAFAACQTRSAPEDTKEQCKRLLDRLQ